MKEKQGSFLLGNLTIQITGELAEQFLNRCVNHGVSIWDIKRVGSNSIEAKIYLKDLKTIRLIRKESNIKIKFKKKNGFPFLRNRIFHNKPLFAGIIISLFVLLFLTNTIWKINIVGVPKELETKIVESLQRNGVHPGALKITLASPNQIQQELLNDIPELLWVGVNQKGTTFHLEGVEKVIVEDGVSLSPRHLVANKSGVIQYTYVESGQPVVEISDFVEKGDLLVSGSIEKTPQSAEDEVNIDNIAAKGEIWATTWYTANISIPLEIENKEITGNYEKSIKLKIGNKQFKIWPWKKQGYREQIINTEEDKLKILKYEFPVSIISERIEEVKTIQYERSKEEAVQIGIEQAKKNLLRELDKGAKIQSEKILHETSEHGKVKLSLYITVLENIAQEQLIMQGD